MQFWRTLMSILSGERRAREIAAAHACRSGNFNLNEAREIVVFLTGRNG